MILVAVQKTTVFWTGLKDKRDTTEGSVVEPLTRADVDVAVRAGVFLVTSVIALPGRCIVTDSGHKSALVTREFTALFPIVLLVFSLPAAAFIKRWNVGHCA